eukprot:scaffold2216_cov154-Skeletonema_menzelii.AAC.1
MPQIKSITCCDNHKTTTQHVKSTTIDADVEEGIETPLPLEEGVELPLDVFEKLDSDDLCAKTKWLPPTPTISTPSPSSSYDDDMFVQDAADNDTEKSNFWTSNRIRLALTAILVVVVSSAAFFSSLHLSSRTRQYAQRIGNNDSPNNILPLTECKGDCDNDQECDQGLVCYQRYGSYEAVPGCVGREEVQREMDYCVRSVFVVDGNNSDNLEKNDKDEGRSDGGDKQEPAKTIESTNNSTMKPIKVYIMMGQSNMLGFGRIEPDDSPFRNETRPEGSLSHAVKGKGLFPYLIDDEGNWTVRNDVRNVQVMASGLGEMQVIVNDWLTIDGRSNRRLIGPEIGIGHYIGQTMNEPVLLLKSCIGNRALGWDLLPPGSEGYEFTDFNNVTWVHPGYGGSPERWQKGTAPEKFPSWYAGIQYDGDKKRAKKVLSELDTYYPGANEYEIAGFFWWQGDRDSRSEALSSHYETNLVQLIRQLRKDFDAPRAQFVGASLGQTKKDDVGNERKILDAILTVNSRYPEFKGNVAAVYSHPLSKGGSSENHYYGHAETFMNIGEAMGCAMMELQLNKTLKCSQLTSKVSEFPSSSPSFRPTNIPTVVASTQSSSSQSSSTASATPTKRRT